MLQALKTIMAFAAFTSGASLAKPATANANNATNTTTFSNSSFQLPAFDKPLDIAATPLLSRRVLQENATIGNHTSTDNYTIPTTVVSYPPEPSSSKRHTGFADSSDDFFIGLSKPELATAVGGVLVGGVLVGVSCCIKSACKKPEASRSTATENQLTKNVRQASEVLAQLRIRHQSEDSIEMVIAKKEVVYAQMALDQFLDPSKLTSEGLTGRDFENEHAIEQEQRQEQEGEFL